MFKKTEDIRISDIATETYQRDIVPSNLRHLREHWEDYLATELLLSRRDGILYCIDGQHRIVIHKERGTQIVRSVVWYGLTKQIEAKMRRAANKTKPDRTVDAYKLDLEAGEPFTVMVNKIVTDCGYHVNPNSKGAEAGKVIAVGTLSYIAKHCGFSNLRNTLQLLHDTWGTDPHATKFWIMRGMSTFLRKAKIVNGDPINFQRVAKLLRRYSPNDVLGSVRVSAIEGADVGVARAIATIYNHRLSTDHKVIIGE